MDTSKLNKKHTIFIEEYLLTGNATASYLKAGYPSSGTNSDSVKASQLLSNPKFKELLAIKKEELAKASLWTRIDSVRTLKNIIETTKVNGDKLSSIKILNEMHGYNEPIKIEHSGMITTIKRILIDPKDTSAK